MAENALYDYDPLASAMKRKRYENAQEIAKYQYPGKIFLEGNAKLVTEYFQHRVGKNVKIAFFGSSLKTDIKPVY